MLKAMNSTMRFESHKLHLFSYHFPNMIPVLIFTHVQPRWKTNQMYEIYIIRNLGKLRCQNNLFYKSKNSLKHFQELIWTRKQQTQVLPGSKDSNLFIWLGNPSKHRNGSLSVWLSQDKILFIPFKISRLDMNNGTSPEALCISLAGWLICVPLT